MDLCGEADGVVRSRLSFKKLPRCSPSLLLQLLNLTCLKRCQCMFSFPLNYGISKILYIETCFLIILILNESLFTRKFGWNMSLCIRAFVETRTQTDSVISLALLPRDYQISLSVLHPAGPISGLCVHTFKWGGWAATELLPHSTGHSRERKRHPHLPRNSVLGQHHSCLASLMNTALIVLEQFLLMQ